MSLVSGLDHINIRTGDVPSTARFFADLLDLQPAAMPGLDETQGRWLVNAHGQAIVHVNSAALFDDQPRTGPTGAIHHVAFACQDRAAMIERLERLQITYEVNDVPQAGLRLLFIQEPNGLLLELNFREAA